MMRKTPSLKFATFQRLTNLFDAPEFRTVLGFFNFIFNLVLEGE
jgi:hypothetical protein